MTAGCTAMLQSARDLPDHNAWVPTCLDRSQSLLDLEPVRHYLST